MSAYLTNAIALAIMTLTLTVAAIFALTTVRLFQREDYKTGFIGLLALLIILIVANAFSRNLFVAVP